MRNSWTPRVVALVALSVFSLSDVAFGVPVSRDSGGATYGSCTTPEIEFALHLDGRGGTAFAPIDRNSYDHGSATDIAVIASFICDTLASKCQANQAALDQCNEAQTLALDENPQGSGGQADVFNAIFGFATNYASVTPVPN